MSSELCVSLSFCVVYLFACNFHFTAENDKRTYRILYEEVDESDVDILKIVSSEGGDGIDEYRYPRAGWH